MNTLNRRDLLKGAALLGGAALLPGCGSSSSTASSSVSRPPIGQESGNLSILEWPGYEAGGTKAQSYGLWAGTPYTKAYGADSLVYTSIVSDPQALIKMQTGGPFDLAHPCHQILKPLVDQGLIQPFDTSLIPSFKDLNPYLVDKSQMNGHQYQIPWEWGYSSLIYRTDKVDPADATGWELAWNEKYAKKISLWNSASSMFEAAAILLGFPNMNVLTTDQIAQAKAKLIEQKPLNKFYYNNEFSQMQPALKSGDVWIAYGFPGDYTTLKAQGVPVAFLEPTQGQQSWFCGFVLGADTKNYYHAHKYVESFVNHTAMAQMTNLFSYGVSNDTVTVADVKDKALAAALHVGNPKALTENNAHLQEYQPNLDAITTAWQEVLSA
jgi:spermidine/putrescine transport system substrate-binding protein